MIPDFEIKVTPGSYEEVSERFKTYLRFRFGIDPASVFITGATGSGKSTASISLAIQYSRGEKCSSGILWLLRPAGQKYRIRGSPKESSATAASCNRERSNPEWSNRRIRFYTG